ncbi:MAG: DUF4296 domain-containing protein [Chitinophagales bacterium]|nr:DUF4296 domain-containing protein [Chitinophagales bacterium]
MCFFLLFSLAFSACRPKSDLVFSEDMMQTIPDTVIGFDQMSAILAEVHLAEALVQETKVDSVRAHRDETLAGYYGFVLDKAGVDQDAFMRSYNWYVDHPLIMNRLYQDVTQRLSILESKYKANE